MSARKRITALRALYWLEKLANKAPAEVTIFTLNGLRDDLRQHVECDLVRKSKRAKKGGAL